MSLVSGEKLHQFCLPVVDAAITPVRPDRPIHRTGTDAQHVFQLVHQIDRRLAETVQLVDERENRNAALFTDLEQFFRLRLDALGRIQYHDRAVHRHQRAIRIFAEILMARRVEDIDPASAIVELQHTGRHRNAALFLNLHPVRHRMALRLAGLDRTRQMDSSSIKKKLFRQSRLARVRVRNDGEGPSPIDFLL